MYSRIYRIFLSGVLLALIATGLFALPHAAAQDTGEIEYNVPAIVTLVTGQNVTRTFSVLPGDTVEIKLARLAEYTYTAVLIDPNQNATPLVPDAAGNAGILIESAPLSGTYSLVLQASAGTGDLLIQVNSNSVTPMPLDFGTTTVDLDTTAIRYELVPPTTVADTLLTLTAITPTTAIYATLPAFTLVNETAGETAFKVYAGQMPMMSVILPAQQTFLLALEPGDQPLQLTVTWSDAASSGPTTLQPQPTQSQSNQPATGACVMYFSGQVNIRSGPGTAYEPPMGSVPAGTTLAVTGHDGSYAWYQVNYNGVPGWAYSLIDATELQGNCNNVTVASYPPPPQAQPTQPGAVYTATPGYTPTYTLTQPTQPGQPTATYTPSYTPTEPQASIAPPDTNYALTVPLDGQVTISEYVSYPDGDTEDVVGYDVSGLNNNQALSGGRADLTFVLLCDGTGMEYINFRIDGQNYSCGSTFHRTVNADSKTGAIRIQATGGSGTYVQWTVIATAPRLN